MRIDDQIIDRILQEALAAQGAGAAFPRASSQAAPDPFLVPVGISNRHVHLSRPHMDALFGPGAELTRMKAMKQPGQYAAKETVILQGPKGTIERVRVLGPLRGKTQVEISIADGFALGVKPPARMSGSLDGTPGIDLIGPKGRATLDEGVIVALRHIHMTPAQAALIGVRSGQTVSVDVGGTRGGLLREVAVRATEASALEMHIDIEEANAFQLKNGDLVRIRVS